jgi:hypothetical protein
MMKMRRLITAIALTALVSSAVAFEIDEALEIDNVR